MYLISTHSKLNQFCDGFVTLINENYEFNKSTMLVVKSDKFVDDKVRWFHSSRFVFQR